MDAIANDSSSLDQPDSEEASSENCFPGHATVHTADGSVRMDELTAGTVVQDTTGSFSRVVGFLHMASGIENVSYLNFELDSGKSASLDITPKHRVFLTDGSDKDAQDIHVGDILAAGQVVIAKNIIKHNSLYAPVTESGMIVVDGVVASCYSGVPHSIARATTSLAVTLADWVLNSFGIQGGAMQAPARIAAITSV